MHRTRRQPMRYYTNTAKVSQECLTFDDETDDSINTTEMDQLQGKTRSSDRQRQQSKTRTTERRQSKTRSTKQERQHEKNCPGQRKRYHSDMSSDDNSEENRIERRKKQKRDYARRKTQRANRDLDSLASDCERRKEENNDVKQQIRDLQTWVKFAESYLTLCRHLHLGYPAPQLQPTGILGHSMTSEAGVTSSLLPTCDVGLSVHMTSHANDSVAWNATGGQVPNTNNLIQQIDPDCMLQPVWKISHTPTTGNLPTPDPTFSAESDSKGIHESQVPNASNLVRTMDSDRQLESVWQPTYTPIAGPLPTPDPAFPVNADSMDMKENQVPNASNLVRTMDSDRQLENVWQPKHIPTNGSLLTPDPIFPVDAEEMDLLDDHVVQDLLLGVQQDFDMQTALEELSQSLPLPVEVM